MNELITGVGHASRALQAAVDALDDAVAARLQINRTDLRALDELLQAGEAGPAWLAARLGVTSGSMTTLLDRLERAGYVTRAPDPADRRKVLVRPTPTLAERAREIYDPIATEGASALKDFTVDELSTVLRFLQISRELQERHVLRLRDPGGRPGRGVDG